MSRDVVIAGRGHEALVAAVLLARSGVRVAAYGEPGPMAYRRLTGRGGEGGDPCDEARWSPGEHDLGLLHPLVERALGLAEHGLETVSHHVFAQIASDSGTVALPTFLPDAALDPYRAGVSDLAATIERLGQQLEPLLLAPAWPADLALFVRNPELLAEASSSAREMLERTVADRRVRDGLEVLGVSGQQLSPRDPGTGLLLVLQLLGSRAAGLRPLRTATSHASGLDAALTACALAAGVEIHSDRVASIEVEGSRAVSATLDSGERVPARAVLSAFDARHTLLGLVGPAELPLRVVRRLQSARYRGTQARMALLLEGEPELFRQPGARWLVASQDQVDRTCDDARLGRYSGRPWLDLQLTSKHTSGVAPEGHSLVTLAAQSAPYALRGGWTKEARAGFERAVLDQVASVLPEVSTMLVGHELLLPIDLEAQFGLTEGQLHGGEMGLDQMLAMRDVGASEAGSPPIRGLHLCSGAAHPGGVQLGLPGLLCARQVSAELELQ